jgi:hypothetical protein
VLGGTWACAAFGQEKKGTFWFSLEGVWSSGQKGRRGEGEKGRRGQRTGGSITARGAAKEESWQRTTTDRVELESSLRPRGQAEVKPIILYPTTENQNVPFSFPVGGVCFHALNRGNACRRVLPQGSGYRTR